MSLILEALKRSEKERQEQATSVTDTLYIERNAHQKNFWPLLIIALLLVNLAIFTLIYLSVTGSDNAAPMPARQKPAMPNQPVATSPGTTHAPPAEASPIARRVLRPLEQELGKTRLKPLPGGHKPAPIRGTLETTTAKHNHAPAPEKGRSSADTDAATPVRPLSEVDQKTMAALEQYEINTIVYSDNRARRFALVNMKKLHENDPLPGSNYRISEITRKGLIIDTGKARVLFRGQ